MRLIIPDSQAPWQESLNRDSDDESVTLTETSDDQLLPLSQRRLGGD